MNLQFNDENGVYKDIRLGQIFSGIKTDSMTCSCIMKNKQRCSNKHTLLYHLNTNDIILSCNISSHKKNAFSNINNNIKANIYKLHYFTESNTIENNFIGSYIVYGCNVNENCNFEHPVIDNKKQTVSRLKNDIQSKITSFNDMILEFQQNKDSLNRYLQTIHKEIQIASFSKAECEKALLYIDINSKFVVSKRNILIEPNNTDILCAICQENITKETSCQLYECSHTFHSHCIQKWFEKKQHINCPCCRADCNHDNYFIFKQ